MEEICHQNHISEDLFIGFNIAIKKLFVNFEVKFELCANYKKN